MNKDLATKVDYSLDKVDDYLDFVVSAIDSINEQVTLIQEGQIQPAILNGALASHTKINIHLIGFYQTVKSEKKLVEEEFQMWWDKAFLQARDKLNDERVKSKYASKSEIESQARVDNAEVYQAWKTRIRAYDDKIAFMRRLLDSWKSHSQLLIQLSNNARTEMKSLYVEDWANKGDKITQQYEESVESYTRPSKPRRRVPKSENN